MGGMTYIQIDLTPEQQEQVRSVTGKTVCTLLFAYKKISDPKKIQAKGKNTPMHVLTPDEFVLTGCMCDN